MRIGSAFRLCLLAVVALVAVALAACAAEPPQPQSPGATPVDVRVPQVARDGIVGALPYVIQPQDTLFSIARRHGTTVEALAALNGIADPAQIRAGDTIFVPGPPVPSGPSVVVRNGDRASNRVALTFDMGGRLDPAIAIMEWLIANHVRATIFPTGAAMETDTGRRVVELVNAHPDLFELGNHSFSHPDFRTLSAAAIAAELHETEAVAAGISALPMRPRFRPPFGAYDAAVLAAVGEAGYAYTVLWDVDTIDWMPEADGGPTAAGIVTRVLDGARGGSIVLMHLGGYNTLDALPGMVAGLRDRGYTFGRLSEILAPP